MKTLAQLISEAENKSVFDCCAFDSLQTAYLDIVLKHDESAALKVLADAIPVTQTIGVPEGNLVVTGRGKLIRNYFHPNHAIGDRAIMIDFCCTLADVSRLAVATQRRMKAIRIGIKKILMVSMGEYVESDFFSLTMLYREATTKRCARCGEIKLVSCFARRHRDCFDRQAWCRECFKLNQQKGELLWQSENRQYQHQDNPQQLVLC